ncbi:NADPH-dependent 1-acyl dihydroxyacetone phosphate reductase [Diatrype stigma]|uniref:NADPH-dependent 1-acyl dihydroxyacetone phosphate reductase n=1 Tax=Diatrype stigma TaxID=117547 RepID=A0AAN9YFA5_9PEZI
MTAIDTDVKSVQRMFDINVFGPMRMVHSFHVSGEVSTNILKNDAHRKLPEGSYYSPLAEEFQKHVTRVPAGATDRHQYARNVVNQSLRESPPAWYWYGSFTVLTRFLDTFGWRTVWVRALDFFARETILTFI